MGELSRPAFLASRSLSEYRRWNSISKLRNFSKFESLQFGDVLFSTRLDALGEGTDPKANFKNGERIALLALTAACDLQHGYAKRFFFIAGIASPTSYFFTRSRNLSPLSSCMSISRMSLNGTSALLLHGA
jgi:hypothetical protein